MERPPPIWEFVKSHTTGRLAGHEPAEVGLGKYRNVVQFVTCGAIMVAVGTMLFLMYQQAKRPAYKADCLGRLRIIHQAVAMYQMDYGGYAPGPRWRWALVPYLDEVGGVGSREDLESIRPRSGAPPRGYTTVLRCNANQSQVPISYFYMHPDVLPAEIHKLDESEWPLFVDETYHEQILVLWADGHTTGVVNTDWMAWRPKKYQVIRDPEWRTTFRYTPAPGRTEKVPPPPAVTINEVLQQAQQGGW